MTKPRRPVSKIRHCGAQHHFVGDCRFHLSTLVNGYVVSTVGEWQPDGPGTDYVTVGVQLYETMVFRGDGSEECGFGWSGPELAVRRYVTAVEANAGHFAMVDKWNAPIEGDDQ